MGGGYIQAVAYGSQDIYLTGNPQITFFKAVYKRHTNFAVESIEVGYLGNADFGGKVICTLPTHGDLVKDIFVEWEVTDSRTTITPPVNYDTTDLISSAGTWLFKQMDLEIGGQLIDRQYADWLKIWSELTLPGGKLTGYQQMTGDYTALGATAPDSNKFIVPLQFFFCRHSGLALPLIALSAAEVKITLYLDTSANLTHPNANKTLSSFKIWADYIFMDTDERRRFSQSAHEYLIEQVQYNEKTQIEQGTNVRMPLDFNYPVKELLWWGFGPSTADFNLKNMAFDEGHIALNGTQRFYPRRKEYFLNVQNYEHHERVPRYGQVNGQTFNNYIYTYSFALEPQNHQPSGVCNFTRLKGADLYLDNVQFGNNSGNIIRVFAHGYNILRIMSGMAGLAYSN